MLTSFNGKTRNLGFGRIWGSSLRVRHLLRSLNSNLSEKTLTPNPPNPMISNLSTIFSMLAWVGVVGEYIYTKWPNACMLRCTAFGSRIPLSAYMVLGLYVDFRFGIEGTNSENVWGPFLDACFGFRKSTNIY